jgi:hypothetical protein
MSRFKGIVFTALVCLTISQVFAQENALRAWQYLGSKNLSSGWIGLNPHPHFAILQLPGSAGFQYPKGIKGWYNMGFKIENDGSRDWRDYYGLQADVYIPRGQTLRLKVTLFTPDANLRQIYLPQISTTIFVTGNGWRQVTLPWAQFGLPARQWAMLKFIQRVEIKANLIDSIAKGQIKLKNIRLTRALQVALNTPARGKSVEPGETAQYPVTVTNCTNATENITLNFEQNGFVVMTSNVTPSHLHLAPGQTATCMVSVKVPADGIPAGGHETQLLQASANGVPVNAPLELITARQVPHPYILHTAEQWAEVRQKVLNYDWAKAEQDKLVATADNWNVPKAYLPPDNYNPAEKHSFVYKDADYIQLQNTAITWQLTRNPKYADKVALMLRRFADEKTGYPSTFSATNNGGPQEGEDIQRIAISYDAVLDAGILTADDRKDIEYCMRLYMKVFEPDLTSGNMGNWGTSQSTAALFCALAMGDLSSANRYIYGSDGTLDFLSKGVMNDGWWWESSTGYNLWVASELTQAALALKPWGIDLINLEVPADYSPYAVINPWSLTPPYGVSFEKWGPQTHNTRSIKRFWDAIPKVADYRGIAFGMNDGHEELVGGQRLELAYYVYRDPAYAAIIKLSNARDLLYGVPELPATTEKYYTKSGYAENIGYALLRSQTPGRQPREQIQVVLKIGTQGGFHGHFDRVSLDNITRYGRSFWNPETIWWGYPNFMYKFYVQTSINHNMVVVDQKQQEAVPSKQLLFHSGIMMQVAAQETNARWSDAPYLGMQYFPNETPADQMRKNKQSLPMVTDRKYGELSPYTERILQRRLAIVTDDYIVIADYLKSTQPHSFDNLFQMKALKSFTANGDSLVPVKHDAQFSNDPHSAAQCITDVNWYKTTSPAVAKFEFPYGPGADNAGTFERLNEPGTLKMDVYPVWPQKQELMLAMPPETHDSQQWVNYAVSGDGKMLAKGESGIWILGEQDIDIPVKNINELTLTDSTSGGKKKSLFWANAWIVTANGKKIPLTDVTTEENIENPVKTGKDYYGGPIKIAGDIPQNAIAAQPIDSKKPGVIHISLKGKNAVRFKATLGGDFPFGPEAERRKIFGIRSTGTEAHFLTVLEPYEKEAMVKKVTADGPYKLKVELADGRMQEITINNFDGDGSTIKANITEYKNGNLLRQETSTEKN